MGNTTTDTDPIDDDTIDQTDDSDDGDDGYDDPDLDALNDDQATAGGRRARLTRLGSWAAVAVVGAAVAAKLAGWGPWAPDPVADPNAERPQVVVQLPQQVVDAIELAHTPGGLSSYTNGAGGGDSAVSPDVCSKLPPATNEALYAFLQGDANLLCQRTIQNGADPCTLYIAVATLKSGAQWVLSTSSEPLPGQKSTPVRAYWCPQPEPTTTTAVPATTTPPPAAPEPAPAPAGQ